MFTDTTNHFLSLKAHGASKTKQKKGKEKEDYSNYTIAALGDALLRQLHSNKKYIERALYWIYKINVSNPLPVFVICEQDISRPLAAELEALEDKEMKELVTDVIRRLYESVDFEYWHTNSMYSKVKWRFDH